MANIRLSKPQDVRRMLSDQINQLRMASGPELIEVERRARAIAYLSNILLSAISQGDLESRIVQIEKTMKEGKLHNGY